MDTFFNFYLNKQLYVVSVFSLKVSINLIFCCGLITFKIGVHCTLFYFNFIVYSLCTWCSASKTAGDETSFYCRLSGKLSIEILVLFLTSLIRIQMRAAELRIRIRNTGSKYK